MSYRERAAEILKQALASETFGVEESTEHWLDLLEVPKQADHGDLAFPCFTLAKALRKGPPMIATALAEAIEPELAPTFSKAVAVGPYVNFTLDKSNLAQELLPSIIEGDFLARRPETGVRVMIEYSQPNTHKAFHVGHVRNVALGDALVRICEWAGHHVVAANYLGDEGAHIAKCLWYFREHFVGEVPTERRGEFLGRLYVEATRLLDFKTLTECPMPGVVTARVTELGPHPSPPSEAEAAWQVVTVDTGRGLHTVVCGGTGFGVGDVVAYAPVGVKVTGRVVGQADKGGVTSDGMILSEVEASLGDDRNRIHRFPAETALGVEVAELLRTDELPADRSVLAEMREREAGVARVLQGIQSGDPELTRLWEETKQWSIDDFMEIYDWLGARFDHIFYESEVNDPGREVVLEYLERGVFVRSEGAVGVDLSEFKLPFFLVLRSDGTGLYSTKDLALARMKFEQFEIDRSVYVVDSTQSLHFQQVFKTLELMGYEKAKDCFHLAYGQVTVPDGKMSSRAGNVILFDELRRLLRERIGAEFLEKYRGEWSDDEIEEAAHHISLATIRYGMQNQDNIKNIVFDLDEWTSKTGNTGPYLMYAYTRTRSVLREVGEEELFDGGRLRPIRADLLTHELEEALLRQLTDFPAVVDRAASQYQPQQICLYLYDLCRAYSRMYNECHVLKAGDDELRRARLALGVAAGRVIQQGLALLGIPTLERM